MSDPLRQEYEALVDVAGAFRLHRWSTVRVSGGDRASFLHNLCTNDVKRLLPDEGCEAFFTDVKGKVVAHAFLFVDESSINVVMIPDAAQRLISHLDRYLIREDVQLVDDSAAAAWLLATGRQIDDALERLAPIEPLTAPWNHRRMSVNGMDVQLVRCDLPWCGGYLIGCRSDDADGVERRLAAVGAKIGSESMWNVVRVESNWPLWGVDFDELNLPQEVGRDAQAISFRKGCYLGQETVARIDALGHVNKRLTMVQFEGDLLPEPGAELRQTEEAVGRITSACQSPQAMAPLAIAMVRRGANECGSPLAWDGGSGMVIAALPAWFSES